MPTLTLAELRTEVGDCVDKPIGDARIPTSLANRWINQAVQTYAELRRQHGTADISRATVTGSASTVAGAGGWPANETVALPADFGAIVELTSVTSLGTRYNPRRISSGDTELWRSTTLGPPELYDVIDATPSSVARLRVWPPSDAAYSYELTYYPTAPALSLDADVWEYLPGTEDFVICSVGIKIETRDGSQEPQKLQTMYDRYSRAVDAMQRQANRAGGSRAMRDTRGQRRDLEIRRWYV